MCLPYFNCSGSIGKDYAGSFMKCVKEFILLFNLRSIGSAIKCTRSISRLEFKRDWQAATFLSPRLRTEHYGVSLDIANRISAIFIKTGEYVPKMPYSQQKIRGFKYTPPVFSDALSTINACRRRFTMPALWM
jgi:hypothetical protein